MNEREARKLVLTASDGFPALRNIDLQNTARLWMIAFPKIPYSEMDIALMRTLCRVKFFPSIGDLQQSLDDINDEARQRAYLQERESDDDRKYKDCWSDENMAYGRECLKKIKAILADSPMMRRVV